MAGLETVEIMLIIISIVLAGYSIYTFIDQKNNLRFHSPKSKLVPYIALLVVMLGFANYAMNGQQLKDLGAAIVLLMFALIMALSRNGIGETGLYFEGVRVSWKQINKVSVEEVNGCVQLQYVRRNATKTIVLTDTSVEEVNSYIKKLRKLYHFGK